MWWKSNGSKSKVRPEVYAEAKARAEARVMNEDLIQLKAKLTLIKQSMRIENRKLAKNEKELRKLKRTI